MEVIFVLSFSMSFSLFNMNHAYVCEIANVPFLTCIYGETSIDRLKRSVEHCLGFLLSVSLVGEAYKSLVSGVPHDGVLPAYKCRFTY